MRRIRLALLSNQLVSMLRFTRLASLCGGLLLSGAAISAEEPIVSVSLADGSSFTVEAQPQITLFGLSERAKPMMQVRHNRPIAVAGYATGTVIRTGDPRMAVQEILHQIAEQSGRELVRIWDSRITAIEPTTLILAVGEKSVWNLLLTPKDEGTFVLSLTCLIDE